MVNKHTAPLLGEPRAKFGEETPVARQVEEKLLVLTEVAKRENRQFPRANQPVIQISRIYRDNDGANTPLRKLK